MNEELLAKLEGLHTLETAMRITKMTKQSTINLLSRLKKEGYVQTRGGRQQKRFYTISQKKFRKRDLGMFDIINKYSPSMKLAEWYDHQVHGRYTIEDALVDAIKTRSFRAILASLHLFKHILDWKYLHRIAKQKDCWQQVHALHDVARTQFRVAAMPKRYKDEQFSHKKYLIRDYATKEPMFMPMRNRWNVEIPFRKGDMEKLS